jgi:lysine N6-hydroxylase
MHYQCAGVEAGPSNLGLASLLYGKSDLRSIFFDQKPEFSWHGQMFPDASLQVSLFKDLVTLAEPTGFLSFVSYLHSN